MELLVQVTDKVNADFYLNCQCPKAGDVIAACPDGWVWGTQELANPDWRILVVPDLSPQDASTLTVPEKPVDPLHPSATLQYRAFFIDLTHPAASALAPAIADSSVADVVAADGDLASIAITEVVISTMENVVPVAQAPVATPDIAVSVINPDSTAPMALVTTQIQRTVTTYPVSDLILPMPLPSIPLVGPQVRTQTMTPTDAATILAIKTQHPPIADPNTIGGTSSNVIG